MAHLVSGLSGEETNVVVASEPDYEPPASHVAHPLNDYMNGFYHVSSGSGFKNPNNTNLQASIDGQDIELLDDENKEQPTLDMVETLLQGQTPSLQLGSLYTNATHAMSIPLRFDLGEIASNPLELMKYLKDSYDHLHGINPDTEVVLKIPGDVLTKALGEVTFPPNTHHFVPYRIDLTRHSKSGLPSPLSISLRTKQENFKPRGGDDDDPLGNPEQHHRVWTDQRAITHRGLVVGDDLCGDMVDYNDAKGRPIFTGKMSYVNDDHFDRWKAEDLQAMRSDMERHTDTEQKFFLIDSGNRTASMTFNPLLWFIAQEINSEDAQEWWSRENNSAGYDGVPAVSLDERTGQLRIPIPLGLYLIDRLQSQIDHKEHSMNLHDGIELAVKLPRPNGWSEWYDNKKLQMDAGYPRAVWNAPISLVVDFQLHGVPICSVPANNTKVPSKYPWGCQKYNDRLECYARNRQRTPFQKRM